MPDKQDLSSFSILYGENVSNYTAIDNEGVKIFFFLILSKNIHVYSRYSSEVPLQGDSNEYLQHLFC